MSQGEVKGILLVERLRKTVAVLALSMLSIGPVTVTGMVVSAGPISAETNTRSAILQPNQRPQGLFIQTLSRLPVVKPGRNAPSFVFSIPARSSANNAPQLRLPLTIGAGQRRADAVYFPYNPKDSPALTVEQYQPPEIKNDLGNPTLSDKDIGGASLNF